MKRKYFKDLVKESKKIKKKDILKILKLYNSDYKKYFKKQVVFVTTSEAKKLCNLLEVNLYALQEYSVTIVSRESEEYQSFRTKIFNKGLKEILIMLLVLLIVRISYNISQAETSLEGFVSNLDLIIDISPFLTLIVFMQQNNRNKELQLVQFENLRKQNAANLILRKFVNEQIISRKNGERCISNKVHYELYNVGLSTAYNINFIADKVDQEGKIIDSSIVIDTEGMIEARDLILLPNHKKEVLIEFNGDNPICNIEVSYYDSSSFNKNIIIYKNKINEPYIKI